MLYKCHIMNITHENTRNQKHNKNETYRGIRTFTKTRVKMRKSTNRLVKSHRCANLQDTQKLLRIIYKPYFTKIGK